MKESQWPLDFTSLKSLWRDSNTYKISLTIKLLFCHVRKIPHAVGQLFTVYTLNIYNWKFSVTLGQNWKVFQIWPDGETQVYSAFSQVGCKNQLYVVSDPHPCKVKVYIFTEINQLIIGSTTNVTAIRNCKYTFSLAHMSICPTFSCYIMYVILKSSSYPSLIYSLFCHWHRSLLSSYFTSFITFPFLISCLWTQNTWCLSSLFKASKLDFLHEKCNINESYFLLLSWVVALQLSFNVFFNLLY